MSSLPTHNGIAYLPDGHPLDEPPAPPSPRRQVLVFVLVFLALQILWGWARGSAVERLLIDGATVRPAAALAAMAFPASGAVAEGTRIRAEGGGLNVLNGCEGTEVLFLLLAAFCATPMAWRRRFLGMALGAILVFALNQARILSLFYAFRNDRSLFDLLHTVAAPLAMIVISGLFFYGWTRRESGG